MNPTPDALRKALEQGWRPFETAPKGARVQGLQHDGTIIEGRTVPRSKFGDHNTVTDKDGFRHVCTHWRPL